MSYETLIHPIFFTTIVCKYCEKVASGFFSSGPLRDDEFWACSPQLIIPRPRENTLQPLFHKILHICVLKKSVCQRASRHPPSISSSRLFFPLFSSHPNIPPTVLFPAGTHGAHSGCAHAVGGLRTRPRIRRPGFFTEL